MDQAVLASLPPSIQLIINVAVFLVSAYFAIKTYMDSKKNVVTPDSEEVGVYIQTSQTKKISADIALIAKSLDSLAKSMTRIDSMLSESAKQNEIDREVRLRLDIKKDYSEKNH